MVSSSQIFIDHSSEPVAVEHYDASQSISNTISDDYLLKMSAREVGQIAADLPSDQVKALKQRRRTLKNREYAAICRSKRSHRGKELRESCDQLQMKVQQLEKQNELFKITLRKIDEVVNDLGISLDGSGKSEANIEFKHG